MKWTGGTTKPYVKSFKQIRLPSPQYTLLVPNSLQMYAIAMDNLRQQWPVYDVNDQFMASMASL